ncbi:hypothetical protein OCAE111667_15565 [Occultella aeris]|uniref:Uncharacterized protein n=1 Tax=Occultella aeris TaxID=2761496 RepID=A0A7M4DMW6_9MICO|nr:hypothetical protein [Occultella aeris]VZO38761.1 hypothetical protein HALOF300_03494 [Occultella aeris]
MRHPKPPVTRIAAAAAIGLGLLTVLPTAAGADAGPAPAGACLTADQGVTVVVDFTDVGGEVEAGCAEGDPTSGREALELAGFTPADSTPGLICTIDSLPDPCPTEFDGNFWSYWTAEPGADWVSATVGADEADPAVGGYEGWRYFDGSAGPTVTSADVAAAAEDADQTTEGSEDATASATGDEAQEEGSGAPVGVIAGIAAVIVVGLVAVLVTRRRAAQRGD